MESRKMVITLALATAFALPAFAQDDAADSHMVMTPVTPIAPAPAQADTSTSSVPMISGGVGEEMNYLKSVENQYNVKCIFAEKNGDYLSAVPVTITDSNGTKLVEATTKGPVLLVTLPDGKYTVTATQAGETKEQKVTVSGKTLHEYVFRFITHDDSGIRSN